MRRAKALAAVAVVTVAGALAGGVDVRAAGGGGDLDAATLVLAATDVPGASVVSQKRETSAGVLSGYERVFTFATPYGASKFVQYDSLANVLSSEETAQLTFAVVTRLLGSKSGQADLAKEFATAGKGVTLRARKPRKVAVGDGGWELDLVIRRAKSHTSASVSILVFHLDRVLEIGTAVGATGTPKSADSVSLAKLVLGHVTTALAPAALTAPTITGAAQQGQMLAATPGTWSATPASYAYQWQRCDATGATCADVPGATAFTYDVTAADAGTTLRVNVTATNKFSSTTAPSAVTAVVQ